MLTSLSLHETLAVLLTAVADSGPATQAACDALLSQLSSSFTVLPRDTVAGADSAGRAEAASAEPRCIVAPCRALPAIDQRAQHMSGRTSSRFVTCYNQSALLHG